VKRAGIIGQPVAHSLSPAMQSAAFRECGLDASYQAWDTLPEALAGRVVSLRDRSVLGANITIPYKEAVIPLLDELGGQSAKVGAVNTVVNRDGRLFGFNTDGPGFVQALRREAGFDPAGRAVLLLGAGGSARGIAFALAEARAAFLAIWNRTPARTARLVAELRDTGVEAAAGGDRPLREYDCVVNCTSLGMHGGPGPAELPADPAAFPGRPLCVDIVYSPEVTPFLGTARDAGLRTLGGLPMLVYQGALAFELWTGVPAPVDAMFEAARRAIREREAARTGRP
jgi:shikimate dehydrogenase